LAEGRTVETDMKPELWQRLKPLYQEAIERPTEQRARFIAEACGNDHELREELAALLRANDEQTSLNDVPIVNLEGLIAKTAKSFCVGELILGRFKIVRPLGSGGMGDVYEASDLELGRVALKTIRSDIADSPEMLSRFRKEVQLARKISSPHVCRVHELFVLPGDHEALRGLFLTMEFLDGKTLTDMLREGGTLPWRNAQAIGIEICAGLQAIHQVGIIHRDLKSRNVMLTSRNGVTSAVLMDFGLARELTSPSTETMTYMTRPGAIAGTPAYMAPEQFEGTELSPATDVYALGVVLYELVTGKLPFAASTPIGAAVLRGRRPQLPSAMQLGVPRHFKEVIYKCLEYEAKRRYQSANEVADSLGARPLSARRLIGRQQSVFGKRAILATIFVILLVITGGILWSRAHRYQPPSSEVQHWYEIGTAALREGTYLKAIREIQVAVDHDKRFALGHARLAEAWSELDFAGRARGEMLLASAPESERNLPALDRMYIEAVRSTLTHDFATAMSLYKAILDALPEREKAYGYVDLGRAREKAGDLNEAVKDYEAATAKDKDNPAAFVHLGVLRSRLQDASGGEAAFKQAEILYQETSNQEGLAEIAYQRGYVENVRGESGPARANLQASLTMARQIPSVQLEIRTLTQMSSVESSAGNSAQAIQYANQAIQLARDNEIGYWSGDGLMRLGNAYLSSQELDKAEASLQAALRLAQQDQQPRLEANARVGLASVRDQQRKWDEGIGFAQEALAYYRSVGMISEATFAAILIVRAQENKKDLRAALQSATELLEASKKSNNAPLIESSEEQMGSVLSSLEDYPKALAHFEEALRIAHSIHEYESYQALNCAYGLWPLGRYTEAQDMLVVAQSGKNADIASAAELVKANILLSQERFAEVISLANREFKPELSHAVADDLPQFRLLRARAELRLGDLRKASDDISELTAWAQKEGDEETGYDIKLVQAETYRKAGSPQLAEPLVDSARRYFSNLGKKESHWLSLLEQARVYRSLGKVQDSKVAAQLALDILGDFEHTWPSSDYRSYTTRPDIKAAQQELASYGRSYSQLRHQAGISVSVAWSGGPL
jgi:tetratricopeptide (TPR) repeat protein